MSSPRAWLQGMAMQADKEASLMQQLSVKHHRIMRMAKIFHETFHVEVKKFYKDIYTGFDLIAFDEFLMSKDDEYRKMNDGEMGEDVDCSMEAYITKKYGEEAAKMVRAFI